MKTNTQLFFKGLTLFFFCATQLGVTPVHAAENVAQLTQNPTGNLVPVKPIEEVAVELQAKQPALPEVEKKDSPLSPATVRELDAKSIKEELGLAFAGNDHRNWSGEFDERWFKGVDRAWYYIVPTGELYRWDGTREGMTEGDELVGKLDSFYHENFAWLKNLSAEALRDEFGFKTSGDFSPNWSKRLDERWFQDTTDQWYYIIPDGSVYRWDSGTRAGMPNEDTFVAQLEPQDHGNLDWLSPAETLIEFQYGEGHLAVKQVGDQHTITITDRSNGSIVREFDVQPDFNFDSIRGILMATTVGGDKVHFANNPGTGAAAFALEDTVFSDLFETNIQRASDFELRRAENGQLDFILRSSGHREPTTPNSLFTFVQTRTHQPFIAPISLFVTRLNAETNVLQNLLEYSVDRDTNEESLILRDLSGKTIFSGVLTSAEFTTEESGIVTALKFKTTYRTTLDVVVTKEGIVVTETLNQFQYGEGHLAVQKVIKNGEEAFFIRVTDPANNNELVGEFEVQPDSGNLYRFENISAITVDGDKVYFVHDRRTGRGSFGLEETIFSGLFGADIQRVSDWELRRDEHGKLDHIQLSSSHRDPALPNSLQSFIQSRIYQPFIFTPVGFSVIRNTENKFNQHLVHYSIDSDTGKESLTLMRKDSDTPIFSGVVTNTSLTVEDSGLITGAQFEAADGRMIDVTVNKEDIDVKITETLHRFPFGDDPFGISSAGAVVKVTENGEDRFFVRFIDGLNDGRVVEEIEVKDNFEYSTEWDDRFTFDPGFPGHFLFAEDFEGNKYFVTSRPIIKIAIIVKETVVESDMFGEVIQRTERNLDRVDGQFQFQARGSRHLIVTGEKKKSSDNLQRITLHPQNPNAIRLRVNRKPEPESSTAKLLVSLGPEDGFGFNGPLSDFHLLRLRKLDSEEYLIDGDRVKILEITKEASGLVTALKLEAEDGRIIDVIVTPEDIDVVITQVLHEAQYGDDGLLSVVKMSENGEERFFARVTNAETGTLIYELEIQDDFEFRSHVPPSLPSTELKGTTADGSSYGFFSSSPKLDGTGHTTSHFIEASVFSELLNTTLRKRTHFRLLEIEERLQFFLTSEAYYSGQTGSVQGQAYTPPATWYGLTIGEKNTPREHRDQLSLVRDTTVDPDKGLFNLNVYERFSSPAKRFEGKVRVLETIREDSGLVTAFKFETEDRRIIDVTVTAEDIELRITQVTALHEFIHEGKRIYALVKITKEDVDHFFVRIYDPGQEGKVIQEFEVKEESVEVSPSGVISTETVNGHTVNVGKGDAFETGAIAYLHVLIPTTSGVFEGVIEKEIYFNLDFDGDSLVVTPYLERFNNGEGFWRDLQLGILNIFDNLLIRRGTDPDATHFLWLKPRHPEDPESKKRLLHISIGRDPEFFPGFNEILFDGVVEVEDIDLEESGLAVNANFHATDGRMVKVTITKDTIDVQVVETLVEFSYGSKATLKVEKVSEKGVDRFFVRVVKDNKLIEEFEIEKDFRFYDRYGSVPPLAGPIVEAMSVDGSTKLRFVSEPLNFIANYEVIREVSSELDGKIFKADVFSLETVENGVEFELLRTEHSLFAKEGPLVENQVQVEFHSRTNLSIRRELGQLNLQGSVDGSDLHFLDIAERITRDDGSIRFNRIFQGLVTIVEIAREESGLATSLRFLAEDGTKEIVVSVTENNVETEILERVAG